MVAKARPYLILLVVIGLQLLGLLFTAHEVNTQGHKFCSIVRAVTSRPVPRPKNPGTNPAREESYQIYEDFVSLRRSLGC